MDYLQGCDIWYEWWDVVYKSYYSITLSCTCYGEVPAWLVLVVVVLQAALESVIFACASFRPSHFSPSLSFTLQLFPLGQMSYPWCTWALRLLHAAHESLISSDSDEPTAAASSSVCEGFNERWRSDESGSSSSSYIISYVNFSIRRIELSSSSRSSPMLATIHFSTSYVPFSNP